MVNKDLEKLGFTKNEVKIYLSLFDLGKVRAGEIIDYTKLHRNIVYTVLDELVRRELASKTLSKGIAEFVANNPDRLIEEVDTKKSIAEKLAESLKIKQEEKPREVAVYEGVEGIKHVRDKTLNLKKENTVHVMGASKLSTMPELEKYWKAYHKKRDLRGQEAKFLFFRGAANSSDWRKNLPNTEVRDLPFNAEMPIWFEFYDDQLGIGLPSENPLLFIIKSKEAVEGFKPFFEYFWNQDVYVDSGEGALDRAFYSMLNELEEGEEYYVLGATHGEQAESTLSFFDQYHKKRIEKGVITNMLVTQDSFEIIKHRYSSMGDPDFEISHVKRMLTTTPQPFQINMYKNKVQMVLYGDENRVMYMDDQDVYAGFKSYFDMLWGQKMATYSDDQGASIAFEDILKTLSSGDELLVMGISEFDPDFFKFIESFHGIRSKKGISARILLNDNAKKMGNALGKLEKTKVKYMKEGVVTPAVFLIYGEKILFSIPNQRTFFSLDNKAAAESFRTYFNSLWG